MNADMRSVVPAAIVTMFGIVTWYARSTTRSLADSGLGSALSASSTSFTY